MNIARNFTAGVTAAVIALGAAPSMAEPIEMRIAMVTPPSHVWTQFANHFAEEMAAATEGEITISVFPAAQLGNEGEMLQQFSAGVLEMGILTAGTLSLRAPDFAAWQDPFAFDNVGEAIAASQTDAAQAILGELEPQGMRGMGYIFAGMRHILMAKRDVTQLSDLGNQKIRILPFPAAQVWWRAAGAVPTPVALGDVYQSLSSGLLDGVDIDLDALVGFSMQQAADHLILTNHMAFPGVVVMSESAWSSLTPEQQAIMTEVMNASLAWGNDLQVAAEETNLTALESEIAITRLDNARGIFAEANDAFEAEFGSLPLLQALREQTGR